MKSSLTNRLALGFGAILLLVGANALVAHRSVQHLITSQFRVVHTYEILREVEADVSLARDVETDTRGYVITSDRRFLEAFKAARGKVKNKLEPLYTMTRDDPEQQRRVLQLADLIDSKLVASQRQIALVDSGRKAAAERLVASGESAAAMATIRAKADEMRAVEQSRLQARTVLFEQASHRANVTIWFAMAFSVWLLALVYNSLARARVQGEQLATALRDLKRLEAMRDSLNAMLVHDLRTPLSTMVGPLELLQAEKFGQLGEIQREIVDMSLEGSRRLLGLVNELLDISKMESGELKVKREPLAPRAIVQEAVRHVGLAEYDGAARIEAAVPENLPLVPADLELLSRVLINLVGNALKFTPATGAIVLGARECLPASALPPRLRSIAGPDSRLGAPSVLFSVHDTGEGIPAADIDRIFDKFGQVESRKSGHKMSTGLGLTFCRLAIEAHGGYIWAESEPGQGSTFSFTVPLQAPPPVPNAATAN